MPNKHYQRGRRFEWQLKKELEEEGWLVLRTAGSHGPFDLIAILDSDDLPTMIFIQCKTTKNEKEIERLKKQFLSNLPLNHRVYNQQLCIKVTGKKGYTQYTAGVLDDGRL